MNVEKFKDSLVLVVDDEPANIFLLDGILSGEGYRVITASNGMEALSLAKAQLPDVILLDLMMPGMSGFQVIEGLTEDGATKEIPIIIVSAKTDVEDVRKALDQGAVDYIRKPINEVDLLARLRTSLRLKNREDALRRLIRMKDQFVSIVSHDLRGPMSHIMLYTQVIRGKKDLMEGLSEEHTEYMDYVYKESARLVDYVEKLLNLAFLESGRLQLKLETVPIKDLVEASIEIYKSKADDKDIIILTNLDQGLQVNVDRTLFVQVLNNLLGNAIKFTPRKGSITLTTLREGDKVMIKVADTGTGIKEKDRADLFSEFTRNYSRGTDGEKGTGLGLSICKKILDAHGFEIDFETQADKGTTFIITMLTFSESYFS